jgi:hypothetical protein
VLAAGLWSALLLVLRLFDKPGVTQHGVAANVGVQWGIFFALAAAGVLAYTGSRMRSAQRPEPPLVRRGERAPGTPRAPVDPEWERPPSAPIGEEATAVVPSRSSTAAARAAPTPALERPRHPPPPAAPRRSYRRSDEDAEQLSFEDAPPREDR